MTYSVDVQIQDCEKSVGIRFVAVDLDRGAEQRLRQNKLDQLREIEELGIDVEQLPAQRLQAVKVDVWLWIEPLKVDIEHLQVLQKPLWLVLPPAQQSRNIPHRCLNRRRRDHCRRLDRLHFFASASGRNFCV